MLKGIVVVLESVSTIDLARVNGGQAGNTGGFSVKNLAVWAGVGAAAAAVPCIAPAVATGPFSPVTYGLCVAGGAAGGAAWNVAAQTGVLDIK